MARHRLVFYMSSPYGKKKAEYFMLILVSLYCKQFFLMLIMHMCNMRNRRYTYGHCFPYFLNFKMYGYASKREQSELKGFASVFKGSGPP